MHWHIVAALVMPIIVVLVTTHYSTYDTTTGQGKPPLEKNWE